MDEELERIASDGLAPGELDRFRTRLVTTWLRELDSVLNRTLAFAKFELILGSAEIALDVPRRLAEITDDDVRRAAATLRPETRTVLELIPGGAA